MELANSGVLAIVGPGITDNAFIARHLADTIEVPCVNWSGHEGTRSRWCFQYQVGSLEEEPLLIVDHLERQGFRKVIVVYDRSAIGERYLDWFERRRLRAGLEVVGRTAISPVAEDGAEVAELVSRAGADCLVYLGLGRAAYPLAVSLTASGSHIPAVANTALMHGHASPDWARAWEGWVYVDMTSDSSPALAQLAGVLSPEALSTPLGPCWFDMGRLVGEAMVNAPHLTRSGLMEGLELVKQLPATCGLAGTTMTLGRWDRGVLKGPYLVKRTWRDGRSVEVD